MGILESVGGTISQAFTPPGARDTRLATRFQTGSFRGAKFFLEAVESDFGRRTVDREYPKRDTPHSEDLGRKAREYSFECFVLGESYEADRDALVAACEAAGPGSLIHPYLGKMSVVCKGCKVKEKKDTLGMAVFSLTFREAGSLIYPAATTDDATAITSAAAALTAASAADLTAKATLLTQAGDVFSMVQTRIGQAALLVKTAALSITHKLQAIQNFVYAVKNMEAKVAQIIATPGMLATQIQDTINLLSTILPGANRNQVLAAYAVLYRVTPVTFQNMDRAAGVPPLSILPVPVTPDAVQLTLVENAIANHIARCAIAQAAVEAVANVYPDLPTAIAMQTELATRLDSMADAIGENPSVMDTDDTVYDALVALRAQVYKSIPPASQTLPKIGTFMPLATLPSLVICYDLYGDSGSASQFNEGLVARNDVRNPCFVPGLQVLQVLKDLTGSPT